MLRYRRAICGMLVAVLVSGDLGRVSFAGGLPFFKKSRPKTCLEQAAIEVDRLERELHQTGTVVIKAPDIWGESRLTKHRQEFEREMEKQITKFELLINANIRRTDQAYLANALAIQAALPGGTLPTAGATVNTTVDTAAPTSSPASVNDNSPITRTNINTEIHGTAAFDGFAEAGKIGLEPTIKLDEMKRYLDHLNEIRRVNEGDDTSDSPGYSLNLVRVPVSLLPGEMTRAGHGAEVTITARPHVSPELLPKVYRDLVINDLVDSLGLAMVKIAEHIDTLAFELDGCGRVTGKWFPNWQTMTEAERIGVILNIRPGQAQTAPPSVHGLLNNEEGPTAAPTLLRHVEQFYMQQFESRGLGQNPASPRQNGQFEEGPPPPAPADNTNKVDAVLENLKAGVATTFLSSAPSTGALARNARQPVAQSQVAAVFGKEQLLILGYEFWKASTLNQRHLPDARSFLKDQLDAGYDYLRVPANCHYWDNCDAIQVAIRSDERDSIQLYRDQLKKPYRIRDANGWNPVPGDIPSPISSAAWLVLVEASLLNAQLNDDLQRVSQDPDCGCQCQGMVYEFFRPVPTEETKQAFVSYVNCRWPVHVFALDPVVQQQNIADQYSMRREMQLALALAFSSGKIGAQSMTRYARRLEIDMETIALNQTVAAFGHGSDTFGWRFTPRVQTPPFDSNLKVICRDMLRGGPSRDDLRKTWELEPGLRECVAIVLMPSFIDHMTFEARGNYFKMTDCHFDLTNRRDLTAKVAQDVRWSQQMQGLNSLLDQIACEQANFLPGEAERVRNRILQLSRRMPMQTVHARVPNENTLGGFEMFSSGVTDLAPELIGFYGEPGVNPMEDTIVYLVGKNFSVHDTHVLAGNRDCEFSLISREVMKVRIPSGVRADARMRVGTKCEDYVVDVHIATPYGVSSHLEIPILDAKEQLVTGRAWGRTEIPLRLKYTRIKPATQTGDFTYTISTSNILTRKPYELPMSTPPFGVNTQTVEVTFEVLWDSNGGLVKLGSADKKLTVPFVEAREQYLISGPQYRDLLQDVVTRIGTLLNEQYKKGSEPAQLELTLSGTVGETPVAGEIHIPVLLELEAEK